MSTRTSAVRSLRRRDHTTCASARESHPDSAASSGDSKQGVPVASSAASSHRDLLGNPLRVLMPIPGDLNAQQPREEQDHACPTCLVEHASESRNLQRQEKQEHAEHRGNDRCDASEAEPNAWHRRDSQRRPEREDDAPYEPRDVCHMARLPSSETTEMTRCPVRAKHRRLVDQARGPAGPRLGRETAAHNANRRQRMTTA